ncbi:coenzyme Q-binding protein COQ10 homolog A, mitochondrial isoform X1 [Mycteria americana]|uniref:coenzyme Q-binding protein COQ10 homolog A, mitochondrial isoform X1 n=1 Tax=Mycteria americana TaxID=33587 RepID=UPI003F581F9F
MAPSGARQSFGARGPVRPPAQPARPASERCRVGAPDPAQPVLPQPHQQAEGVLGAAHHRVLHAGDVRRGLQRGGLQELRALVQEVGGGLQADGPRQGPAGGGLPARGGALHLHRHPRPPTPRQGRLHGRAPLQPPGDELALQPRHPRLPPHQHRGFLDLLRVSLPAALPAGHRLLRRGGQADGGSLRAPGGQELRSRDPHPPGTHVPRGPPDVRVARPPRTVPGPRGHPPCAHPPQYLFECISAAVASTSLPAPGARGDAPASAGAAVSPRPHRDAAGAASQRWTPRLCS